MRLSIFPGYLQNETLLADRSFIGRRSTSFESDLSDLSCHKTAARSKERSPDQALNTRAGVCHFNHYTQSITEDSSPWLRFVQGRGRKVQKYEISQKSSAAKRRV